MSLRNRRRRSELELLEEARTILFPEGSDEEDLTRTPTQPAINLDEPDHPTQPNNPDTQMEQMEQMTALMQALQLAGRPSFKPPSFSGEEDVELFVRQFGDVADANRWSDLEKTLHLRGQLSGDAYSCGQGESWQEIVEDLRARYGLTRAKARDKLSKIQLKAGQNVHKQAAEISRLVGLAFPILPETDQREMALEYFSRSWEDRAVQQHLLAVRPANLREAVRTTEDFLAIQTAGPRPRAHVVEQAEEETCTSPSATELGLAAMAEAIRQQTALLQQVILQLGQQQTTASLPPVQRQDQQLECYNCGGPHFKRNCPSNQSTGQAGNARGPAQA